MAKDKIYIRERIFVPARTIDIQLVKETYARKMYDHDACRKCENKEDRHNYLCDTCEAYQGEVKTYSMQDINGERYVGLPSGERRVLQNKIGFSYSDYKIIDKRNSPKFDYPVKAILDLRENQKDAVADWLKAGFGILKAPPRTGKTVMALTIGCRLGYRMVMLAKQHEFLQQFLDHIHGNEEEGIPKCTNLPELEKKHGKKLYGFPKTQEDFDNFQIMAMTYQQFISETSGKKRLRMLQPNVGTLLVDEVHTAAAPEFAGVIQRFKVKHRCGITATVDRKDRREFVVKQIFGPIVARSTVESLIPTTYVHETGFQSKRAFKGKRAWVFAMQALAKDKKRNQFIVDYVMKDLANGHNIVIPVVFKKHVFDLQEMINKAWEESGKKGKICDVFVGGGGKKNKEARKTKLLEAKLNKTRVIIGIRSLLQLGLNVPSWSCIYTAMPISNQPNYEQETSRVRTPQDGKRKPIVRIFFEEGLGQSIGCARNCLKHVKIFGYDLAKTEKQKLLMEKLQSSGRGDREGPDSADDQFKVHRFDAKSGKKQRKSKPTPPKYNIGKFWD